MPAEGQLGVAFEAERTVRVVGRYLLEPVSSCPINLGSIAGHESGSSRAGRTLSWENVAGSVRAGLGELRASVRYRC